MYILYIAYLVMLLHNFIVILIKLLSNQAHKIIFYWFIYILIIKI